MTAAEVGPARASHRLIPHTADVGFEAVAPDPAALFAEAARAVGALSAEVGPGIAAAEQPIEVAGRDLEALAFAWLNELVATIDLGQAIVEARVHHVDEGPGGERRLQATLTTVPFSDLRVRRRAALKSATYHGLQVRRTATGRWRLIAYLDV